MKMVAALSVAVAALCSLCSLCLLASASELPRDVESGFFPGRSGNVIVEKLASRVDGSVTFLTDRLAPSEANLIMPSRVVDVMARSLGMTPFNPEYTPAFLKTNILDSARANVLLSVVGLGKDAVGEFQLANITGLMRSSSHASFDFVSTSVPYTPLATAASIACGTSPAVHGIVGPAWTTRSGASVHAFSDPMSSSSAETTNLASVLAQTAHGEGLIVSVSSCKQHAMVHCVHPRVFQQQQAKLGSRVACLYLDEEGSFRNVYGPSPLAQSADDIRSQFSSMNVGASYDAATKSFSVTSDADGTVQFDTSVREYYTFFAELQFALTLATRLSQSTSKLWTGSVHYPHFVAVSLAALEGIAARDGRQSVQYAAAVAVLDNVLPLLVRSVDALYGFGDAAQSAHRSVVEIVLLPSAAVNSEESTALVQRLRAVFERYRLALPTIIEGSMHVNTDATTLRSLCSELSTAALALGYQIYCPTTRIIPSHLEISSTSHSHMQLMAAAKNGTSVSPAAVDRYQIVLWLAIILVFTVIFAAYSIGFMENKKDTLLYSRFNPNWGKKQH